MNSLKVTIVSATVLLILLIIFAFQLYYLNRSTSTFTCRGNISLFNATRNFTGSLQFTVNQGQGSIMLLGTYTDEKGIRHLASVHNELHQFSRDGDLYALRFSKASIVPKSLATDSMLESIFHPYLLDGKKGKMFYHIFTQPSGNKIVGFGKIPELACQTPH